MKINNLKITSLLVLTILSACSNNNINTSDIENKNNIKEIKKINDLSISGQVNFPVKFKTKATQADISTEATVSIIVPSSSAKANSTIAVGLTDDKGKFRINPDLSFNPQVNDIYILEARKRLGAEGNAVLTLKTFIKWTSAGWTSITGGVVYISTKTTALCIMSGYNSNILSPDSTIGKLNVINGVVTNADINDKVKAQDLTDIEFLVNSSLNTNQDPTQKIMYANGILSYNSSSFYYPSSSGNVSEITVFNGKVFDPNLVPVEGAIVNAQSIDAGINWVGQTQITVGGAYVFRNVPAGARIVITVTKDGWTTRTRSEVLKSNLQGDPNANVFDFSGSYSIQDEPEVTQLKINGRLVNGSSNGDLFTASTNAPKNTKPTPANLDNGSQITNVGNVPNLTGVNGNILDVEMTFSEPVRRDDVENYFRMISQSGFDNKVSSFTVDNNYSGVRFEWSADDKVVTFKTNKAILSNRGGDEARYLLDFSQSFRDKSDRTSIDRRYFRFSPSQINDFAVFSVRNDEEAPKLLGITARDGGGSNDLLELRYSESMELINQASYTSGLVDQLIPADTTRQLYAREANSQAFDLTPVANSSFDNNATLLGYLDSANGNNFRASYMVGRVLSKNVTNGTPRIEILGTTVNTAPTKVKIISARITNNIVTIELDRTSFDRDDRVIVSAGDRISGSYVDRNRTPSVNEDLNVSTNPSVDYSVIFDPSGRLLDTGNSSTSANIDVTNKQRVATAS